MPTIVKDKSGTYFLVFFVNGKRIWRSTRTKNKSEAYHQLRNASHVPTSVQKQIHRFDLIYFIQQYLSFVKTNHSIKTYEIYDLALKKFYNYIGNISVYEINTKEIEFYKIERMNHVSPVTINIELRSIKTFFNFLKHWEYITKNPCDGVKQLKIPMDVPPYFTIEQLHHFLQSLSDVWLKEIVLFAAMTGMRLGEILNLTWNDINLNDKSILIRSSANYQVKGGRMRSIPMNQTVYTLLNMKNSKEGLVFTGRRGGLANPNYVSATFRKELRMTNLNRKLHFHSLRHTFASLLVKNNVSIYQVQKLLGHSSIRVTEIYAHLQCNDLQNAVNKLSF